jgi:hypothetical protein
MESGKGRNNTRHTFALEVLVPIVVGGAIYLLARPSGLRMFAWARTAGAANALDAARSVTAPLAHALPEWVRYSLPDALWSFAFTTLMGLAWKHRATRASAAWLACAPAIAIGSEIGQAFALVPGTFDIVDLGFVSVACALGLRRVLRAPLQARSHALSAIALVAMLALAFGSHAPTAAEMEAGAAAADADKKLVDDYVTKMGAAYTMLAAMNMESLPEKQCNEAVMLQKSPPKKDDYGRLELPRVYGPYMARFASKNKADWTKFEGEWTWLTEFTYGGHFETFPAARESYAVSDTARRVREEFIPKRYTIVIWPTSKENRMPVWHKEDEKFEGGYFAANVLVVDIIDKSVFCQRHIVVQSSDLITYRTRGLLREKPESALKDDFENLTKKSLEHALPEHIKFGPMGTIF